MLRTDSKCRAMTVNQIKYNLQEYLVSRTNFHTSFLAHIEFSCYFGTSRAGTSECQKCAEITRSYRRFWFSTFYMVQLRKVRQLTLSIFSNVCLQRWFTFASGISLFQQYCNYLILICARSFCLVFHVLVEYPHTFYKVSLFLKPIINLWRLLLWERDYFGNRNFQSSCV